MYTTIKTLLTPVITILMLVSTSPVMAGFIDYFKDEQGNTKWQYVANFSSGVLIILLSIVAIILFFSRRQINHSNKALKQINDELEERVRERTATLDESNKKLLKTTHHLQASESYIKSILESMPIMLVGLNQNDEVTQWNQAAEKLTGLKTEDAMGQDLWQAYPTLPLPRERVHEAIEKKESVHIRHSQRGQLHFEITIYPLENFIQTGVVILVDDVTQMIQSENKLIEKDKLSAMGELSSVMAYDISAPLKRIGQELDVIQQACPNSSAESSEETQKIQVALDNLRIQSVRANAIVKNLLDFSGGSQGAFQPQDILEIIDHSIDLSNDIFASTDGLLFSDIEIERLYEDNLPRIPCFQSELQQVFVSLFRYCLYAIQQANRDDHKPKITVQVLTSYDNLWVKVSHNGLGIDLEEQQVIFEPFFSDDVIATEERHEANQRLSFPYFIVTQHHHGNMAVTSNVDIGTTFHLELPLK